MGHSHTNSFLKRLGNELELGLGTVQNLLRRTIHGMNFMHFSQREIFDLEPCLGEDSWTER